MKKQVIIVFWILLILLVLDGSLSSESRLKNYADGEVILKYKDNVVIEDKEAIKEFAIAENMAEPYEVEKIIPTGKLYNLKFNSNNDVQKIIEEYSQLVEVEYAESNYIYNVFTSPNDANYSLQWELPNINAEQAWNLTTGNSSAIIAIIDTGIDWNHPDLSLNIWNNTDEDCTDGIDNDGNGYIDDCRGYDFVNVTSGCSDDDCDDEDNNPADAFGHGTHVAGIAGAVSNNNLGVAGVCWNCSLMAVRAGYKDTSGQGSLTVADIVQALNYATFNNATIISMSFGGSDSVSVESAINDSYSNGSILVASAGNDGANTKKYPCAYNNVICVAGTDSDNTSASYSNYGAWINLSAPGTSIWSTYYDDTYASLSGTSMAAPIVAGAIGLIKTLFPDQNQTQIETTLNNTGTPVDFNGVSISRINIYSAILSLDNISPSVNLTSPSDNHINLTQNQTFICNATDWQLNNVTLQIWNSSELYYNATQDVSGISGSYEFNVSNLAYNNYKWNCLVYDTENNFGYAGSNFTFTIGNITAALVSPVNGTNTNVGYNEFNCSAQTETSKELNNITFYLWNSTGLVYNISNDISGVINSSLFNYTFSLEGEYLWNCKAYNNISESVFALANFTIVYDILNPDVSLESPANSASYTSSSQSVTLNYNVSDVNAVANCSLIVGGVVDSTDDSITKGVTQSFSKSFTPGTYNWNVNCSDSAGNIGNSSVRSFTVSAPASTSSSSSGSGGSSSVISSTSKIYIISGEQASSGYTQKLKANDKIKFIFFDEKAEEHSLIVSEVEESYVMIVIQSSPIYLTLGIGQSAKINLTSPDYYDLYIKINSVEDKKVDLTIQTIHEEIPKTSVTGGVVEDDSSSEELSSEGLDKLQIAVYFLVFILILAIIFIFISEKKHIKKQIRNSNLKGHKEKFNKYVKPKKLK